ncbi:hypothetical protein LINGRAHAP2_LOCUS2368 [Linum grandiflorum]
MLSSVDYLSSVLLFSNQHPVWPVAVSNTSCFGGPNYSYRLEIKYSSVETQFRLLDDPGCSGDSKVIVGRMFAN